MKKTRFELSYEDPRTINLQFENKQIHLSRLMYFGTNGVVSLFTNDDAKAKQIRKLVLKFADRFPPVKSLITKHLTESKKSNLIPF